VRKLTPVEAGLILGVVALLVLCCLGCMTLGTFAPQPAP
jgi:hypothetical protein